jgi:hypothetical protein
VNDGQFCFGCCTGPDRCFDGWVPVMGDYEITLAIVVVWVLVQVWIGIEMIRLWDKVKDNEKTP